MSFFHELKRRNVFRMAMLYGIASWLLLQVAEVISSLLPVPAWTGKVILVVLAIGLPISLIFSWFYEITPEGVKLEKNVERSVSMTNITGRRMDFIVISILIAAVLVFSYDKWWLNSRNQISVQPQNSIAVLPFINMSDDPNNEYFSDGISEELLNLLARVPELRVVSRTSAFAYKDKDVNLVDVARELNVSYILEGSVRKAGRQVRITAQLIEARTDSHLWSETFDRAIDDIFSVQSEIATVVVEELKVSLLGPQFSIEMTDPEAYSLFLQALYLSRTATEDGQWQALQLLEKCLEIDPKYVPAWLGLGTVYSRMINLQLISVDEAETLMIEANDRALDLAPNSASVIEAQASFAFMHRGDMVQAAQYFERALMLEPTNTNFIGNASLFLTDLGRIEQAVEFAEYQVARDPANAVAFNNLGIRYRYSENLEGAKKAFETALRLNPDFIGIGYELGATLLQEGEFVSASQAFENEPHAVFRKIGLAMSSYALGDEFRSDKLLGELIDGYGGGIGFYIAEILAFRGDYDKSFFWLEEARSNGDSELGNVINEPLMKNLRTDPRWQQFLDSIGRSEEKLSEIKFGFELTI